MGEKEDKLHFEMCHLSAMSRFVAMWDANALMVNVTTLDNFIVDHKITLQWPLFIKIDTEGFEYKVLQGMKYTLASYKDIRIIMEIWHGSDTANQVFAFLDSLWFSAKKLWTHHDFLFYKSVDYDK